MKNAIHVLLLGALVAGCGDSMSSVADLSPSSPLRAATARGNDFRQWADACIPGSFQGCVRISLGIVYDPATELSAFTMRFSNLQGWAGQPNSGPYGIRSIRIHGVQGSDPSFGPTSAGIHGFSMPIVHDGRSEGVPFWEGDAQSVSPAEHLWGFSTETFNGGMYVWGCSLPPAHFENAPDDLNYQGFTCEGGSMVTTFSFTGNWSLTDQTAVEFQGVNLEHVQVGCRTDVNCVPATPDLMAQTSEYADRQYVTEEIEVRERM